MTSKKIFENIDFSNTYELLTIIENIESKEKLEKLLTYKITSEEGRKVIRILINNMIKLERKIKLLEINKI
jgi:hypothetical protein